MSKRDFAMEAAEALRDAGHLRDLSTGDVYEAEELHEVAYKTLRPIIEAAQAAAKPVEVVGGDEELLDEIDKIDVMLSKALDDLPLESNII